MPLFTSDANGVQIQYIDNTFKAAKGSISINGMSSKEMDAEVAKAQEGEGRQISVDLREEGLTVWA